MPARRPSTGEGLRKVGPRSGFYQERMGELFGPDYRWVYVTHWRSPTPVRSASGLNLMNPYRIRHADGRELIVSRRELIDYARAGHTLPRVAQGRRSAGSLSKADLRRYFGGD